MGVKLYIADEISRAQALIATITSNELEFLRGLVAGDSTATIARRLTLERTEALAIEQSLMRKLGAKQSADAVRIGIYAGLKDIPSARKGRFQSA